MRVIKLSLAVILCLLGVQLLPAAPLDPGSFTPLAATFAPSAAVSINTTTLDMTGGATFTGVNSGGVCVFCFGSVSVGVVTFNVTGTRPVAILSQSTMTWGGTINANAATTTGGPGGYNGAAAPGNGSGPGAGIGDINGGSGGGYGGKGGDSGFGTVGGPVHGDLLVTLQGGSGGGRTTFFAVSQNGGGGGGAVELGSSGILTISAAAVINAVGAAGGDFLTGGQDGGGGGAGGGILLHGSSGTIAAGSMLNANGGRGGNVAGGTRICEGGGGGGGRIHLVNMTGTGTTNVTGGVMGTGGGGGTAGAPGTVTTGAAAFPPTLSSVTPSSGPIAGGTNVTLTGTNFTGATSVTFGGTAATTFTVVSATSITATTPAHAAGAVSVVVTTPGGSNAPTALFTYTASAAPTVTGVTPATGPTTGGTSVTITGTDFSGATSVTFGGTPATLVTVTNSTSITAVTPAHAAGPVSVIVTTPAGSNAANTLFTYTVATAPEMDVSRGLTPIPIVDGGIDNLGQVPFGASQAVTYTITNSGNGPLNLTGTPNLVTVTAGTNVSSALVTTQPAISTVAPAGTVSFTVTYTVTAIGPFDFSIDIPNSDANEGPYNWTVSGSGSTVPEMDVVRGTAKIEDGCFDSVGNVALGTTVSFSYTIYNTGNADLTLVNPVNLIGVVNCTITVTSQPTSPVVPFDSATLIISVSPKAPGLFSCVISIGNNDPDENPYNWTLIGAGPGKIGGGGNNGTHDNGNCTVGETSHAWMFLAGMIVTLGFAMRLRRRAK
ncbi:hypothetical protein PLCT2_00852 [Planctomycetaceae bacterium]|nr:hypothetical protein PLCT2_00852 [Planctomycetaceae bacterium]